MTRGSFARVTVVDAVVVAVFVVVLALGTWARVSEGRSALAACDAALERGDAFEAILAARVAAEARCPGCGAPQEGYARLAKIARAAEARGDDATAFGAWRATRAAALATSSVYDGDARRVEAEHEIARLGYRIATAGDAEAGVQTEPRLRAALAGQAPPGRATHAVIGAGALAFFYAAVSFSRQRTSGKGRWVAFAIGLSGVAVAVLGALAF